MRLGRVGRERALIYRTLIYTGLRKGELASVTVGAVHLDAERPYLELAAKNAKSGKAARIPLRQDLAAHLAAHLSSRQKAPVVAAWGNTFLMSARD